VDLIGMEHMHINWVLNSDENLPLNELFYQAHNYAFFSSLLLRLDKHSYWTLNRFQIHSLR
jgi:hypothetical protein